MSAFAPKSVVASAIVNWDPQIDWIIDQWWNVKSSGGKFDAPKDAKWFGWKDGSGDVANGSGWAAKLPDDVKKLVQDSSAAIKDGTKKVELNLDEVKSE
jgi:basic membrane lipoprotein Med (substrate-binding protein (PBP1-ABC) superfamily)